MPEENNAVPGSEEEALLQIQQFEMMRQAYPLEITFEEERQKELVEIVMLDYKVSEEARQAKDKSAGSTSWEDKLTALLETWEGVRKPKTKPFKGCSNKTMRLTTAIEQTMHSQYLASVWKGGEVTFRPGERTDNDRVRRLNKFMTWIAQVGVSLYDALDDYVHSCTKLGAGIFKYSWKQEEAYLPRKIPNMETGGTFTEFMPTLKEGAHVITVPIDAMYFQPGAESVQGPHPIIHKIPMSFAEVNEHIAKRQFLNKTESLQKTAASALEKDIGPIAKVEENVELRAKYNAQMRNFPQVILEWYGRMDVEDPRGPQECVIWVEKNSRTYLSGKLLRTVNKRNKRPFVVSPCMKRGSQLLGIGYVELAKPLSDEVDAQFNQANDANTLDIMPSGFYHPTSGFDPDKVELGPNVWLPVENPVQNVYMPTRNRNTEKFMMIIRTVMMFVERLTAASSYQMGKEDELVGGTGSATRTNQIVAHAEIRMGPIMRRVASGWSQLLTELYYLYYQNAPAGYAERIVGETGAPLFPNMALQMNFLEEADAYCIPDMTLTSTEAQQKLAMWVFDTFSVHPLVITNIQRTWQVANEVLVAMKHPDPDSVIGPNPGVNPDLEVINIENTRMLQGEMLPVNPTDIDIQHIPGHMGMLQTRELPAEIRQIIGAHVALHQQRLQGKLKTALGGPEDGQKTGAAQPREANAAIQ